MLVCAACACLLVNAGALCVHCSDPVWGLVQGFEKFDTLCRALVFDHISVECTPRGNCLHFVPSLGATQS